MPPAFARAALEIDPVRFHARTGRWYGIRLLRGHDRGLDDLLLHGRGRDDDLVEQLALGVVLRSPKNFLFRCELLEPGSYLNQGLYELRSPSSSDQTAERPSDKAQVTTRQNPPHRSDVVPVGTGGAHRVRVGGRTALDEQNSVII